MERETSQKVDLWLDYFGFAEAATLRAERSPRTLFLRLRWRESVEPLTYQGYQVSSARMVGLPALRSQKKAKVAAGAARSQEIRGVVKPQAIREVATSQEIPEAAKLQETQEVARLPIWRTGFLELVETLTAAGKKTFEQRGKARKTFSPS